MPEHTIDNCSSDPALAVVAAEPVDERHPDSVDAVAELGEQAGNTVNEPSIATATTVIVATANDANRVSGEEHAGHGDQDRATRDEHRAAGRSSGLERGLFASTGGTLFALRFQVEHRVVDARRRGRSEG